MVAGLNGTLDCTTAGFDRKLPSVPITRQAGYWAFAGAQLNEVRQTHVAHATFEGVADDVRRSDTRVRVQTSDVVRVVVVPLEPRALGVGVEILTLARAQGGVQQLIEVVRLVGNTGSVPSLGTARRKPGHRSAIAHPRDKSAMQMGRVCVVATGAKPA